MTATELILRDPLGERPLSAGDFPLDLGGRGRAVVLPGAGDETLAWLALHEGQLFLQPVEGGEVPRLNGAPVARATWLRAGDVIDLARGRLRVSAHDGVRAVEVEDGSGGNITVPPEAPAIAVVTGGDGADEERVEAVAFRRAAAQQRAGRGALPRVVAAIALVALALVAWFFTTGRVLTIGTQPADASVHLRGGLSLRLGEHHYARPGRYEVQVARAGYRSLSAPVTITDAGEQRLMFRLQKLPGRIVVQAPASGRAAVAGRDVGAFPGAIELPAGRQEITLTAARYLPYTATVEVTGGGERQTLNARLVPAWAPVAVASEPAGAAVLVDGRPAGTTPAKLELDAGTHRLELRHPGFKPWVTDLQVVANEAQSLGPVRLGLPDGTLVVRTEPAGASVSVGGAFRGRSPLTLEVRPDVPLAIVATREGYEPATNSAMVGAGERREISLALAPILGELTVQS
ncbi:MAG: PEGA domain-containing protein, partial [Steroidobacteraceae bacterium]